MDNLWMHGKMLEVNKMFLIGIKHIHLGLMINKYIC